MIPVSFLKTNSIPYQYDYRNENSITFTGSSYINGGKVLGFGASNAHTFFTVVERGTIGTTQYLLSNYNGTAGVLFRFTASNTLAIEFRNSATIRIVMGTVADFTKTTGFYVIAYTCDGSGTAAGIKIYVNGTLFNTTVTSDNLAGASTTTATNFNLGRLTSSNNAWFVGKWNYSSIITGAYTEAQVKAHTRLLMYSNPATLSGVRDIYIADNATWNGSNFDITNTGSGGTNPVTSGVLAAAKTVYSPFPDLSLPVRYVNIRSGQSNCEGLEQNSNLQSAYVSANPNANIKIWNGTTYVTMDYTLNNNQLPQRVDTATTFGSEFSFGTKAATLLNKPIYIIKYGVGSTALGNYWKPGFAGYSTFILGVKQALFNISDQRIPYIIVNHDFIQGETDLSTPSFVTNYGANLLLYIAGVRADLADPNLHITISQLNANISTGTAPDKATIQAAQASVVSGDVNTSLIVTNSYTFVDGLHYDAAGLDLLGNSQYSIFKQRF